VTVARGVRGAQRETRTSMSKRLSSTILLFLIGIGFSIFALPNLIGAIHAHNAGDIVLYCLYLIVPIVAFGALIMLPFKQPQ
jgi:hypothetical protein